MPTHPRIPARARVLIFPHEGKPGPDPTVAAELRARGFCLMHVLRDALGPGATIYGAEHYAAGLTPLFVAPKWIRALSARAPVGPISRDPAAPGVA